MKLKKPDRSRLIARPFDGADTLYWQRCAFPLALLTFFILIYSMGPIPGHDMVYHSGEWEYWISWEPIMDLSAFFLFMTIGFVFPWIMTLTGQRAVRYSAPPVWGQGRRRRVAQACLRHSRLRGV